MKKIIFVLATILLVTPSFAQYTKLFDFAGAANGSNPYGSLVSDGSFLYGMTLSGGTYNNGVIFKIKPDGTGYAKLLDFTGVNGRQPYGSLISDGTFLYGMTREGGTIGTVFRIKPDGTGYNKLLDFTGVTNGKRPQSDLVSDGTFLYGMTRQGGANDLGTVFKIMPDGSGYAKLLDFAGTANGSEPIGALISDGIFLYGMTSAGGANNMGLIFQINSDGTGYADLLDFTGVANGQGPFGSLISDGTYLYGMTEIGGNGTSYVNGSGTIFKIKSDGTGYSKLHDFTSPVNGALPFGSLISDGIFLYGMTFKGGTGSCTDGCGTLFKIKTDGTGFTKLLDFTGTANGSNPNGSLISDGIFLYGMTSLGGANNFGTVFKYQYTPAGIAENNSANSFNVYPNPFNHQTTVIFAEEQKNITIKIIDVIGKEIKTTTFTGKQLTIEKGAMKAGIYFVRIIDNDNIFNKKIIVE